MNYKNNNINALILIGGKSTRMGTDKSKLVYHKTTQIDYVFNVVKKVINKENIYFSIRDSKQLENKSVITDNYPDHGPFGAILSAFEYDSSTAWLVIAIDLPFVNEQVLKLLLSTRNSIKMATTFKGIGKDFPEPLITIWEPKSYSVLKAAFIKNKLSLVSILKNNNVKLIEIEDHLIQNINTKKEYDIVRNKYLLDK